MISLYMVIKYLNLMRKKNINYAEQIKNSENFLQKLESIKNTSKDIKHKNKLTFHRNIWVKEFKYLSRLERETENQLDTFLENLDQYMHFDYDEKEIFKRDDYKSYRQMKDQLNNNCELFQHTIFKHMQDLPLILHKYDALKASQINYEDIQDFIKDIEQLLKNTEVELARQQENNRSMAGEEFIAEQYDEGYDDIVFYLKPIADEVKGFDFKKQRLKKIEQGQSHLMDYLLTFKEKLTGDQISEVIEEFNHANNLLHETIDLEIEKINLDYEDVLNFSHPIIQNNVNYQKFLHIYQTYMGRGKNLIQYFERLAIEFPKISKQNLQNINNYIVGKIYKDRKIKAAKRNFLREKEELFYKVEKEVNMRIEKKIKDAQREAEQLMRREEKLKLQKQLQILRAQYRKRQEQKQRELQLIQNQRKAEEKKKDSLRRLYLDDLSKRAEEVKQIKQEKQKVVAQTEKQKREQLEIEKKRKILENQPKVRERQSIQRKRIEKKVQARQYKQKQKQINEERINRAIEQYPFRPQVLPSEQRLNAPTEAMIKRKEVQYDMADKVELSKKTGYSVNQLMSDMRFRLNVALQEAGLAQTEYARQVLTQMSKKPG